jgi:hypothetical protein
MGDQYSAVPEATFPKEMLPALSETKNLLRILYEIFYKPDTAKSEEFIEKIKLLKNNVKILLKNTKHAQAAHRLATITEMLDEMSWIIYSNNL